MNRPVTPTSHPIIPLPRVPAWAVPRSIIDSDVEAAYMAGSALNSLDNLVRSDVPWLGAWRQRLALKAAAATVKLMRRTEDESALRDAWYLRQPGDDPGPAGRVLQAWRKLTDRSLLPTVGVLQSVADLLGNTWSDVFAECIEEVADGVRSAAPAPVIAARAATAIMHEDPKAEALAWWTADLALSWRMAWRHAVPLLATQIHSAVLRTGHDRRRARPDSPDYERAICLAVAAGAAEACRLAAGIAQQAERLHEVTPKLRAKGAGDVIALLLSDDAVSGSFTSKAMTRWASRRLFDRLQQLDAVRELSGRPTFRLYGL